MRAAVWTVVGANRVRLYSMCPAHSLFSIGTAEGRQKMFVIAALSPLVPLPQSLTRQESIQGALKKEFTPRTPPLKVVDMFGFSDVFGVVHA